MLGHEHAGQKDECKMLLEHLLTGCNVALPCTGPVGSICAAECKAMTTGKQELPAAMLSILTSIVTRLDFVHHSESEVCLQPAQQPVIDYKKSNAM